MMTGDDLDVVLSVCAAHRGICPPIGSRCRSTRAPNALGYQRQALPGPGVAGAHQLVPARRACRASATHLPPGLDLCHCHSPSMRLTRAHRGLPPGPALEAGHGSAPSRQPSPPPPPFRPPRPIPPLMLSSSPSREPQDAGSGHDLARRPARSVAATGERGPAAASMRHLIPLAAAGARRSTVRRRQMELV